MRLLKHALSKVLYRSAEKIKPAQNHHDRQEGSKVFCEKCGSTACREELYNVYYQSDDGHRCERRELIKTCICGELKVTEIL